MIVERDVAVQASDGVTLRINVFRPAEVAPVILSMTPYGKDSGERVTRGCHDLQCGQQLAGPVHIDAQLLQNRRAIGPDGHGAATCPHIRPLFEDGDVMSVPQ